ncbi:hypothetical protein BT96DRAFT_966607 [Gymnopus androsaceus JB14]|uniref:Uncharacterized protein n=1 Tax=Gymnopus androsaceus JB14 TaxID=1447944 RepID=A0A6A4HG01_9AGAR|nr:hypothetical protein BT96DRAFT_966607 [Gymnopus androsaceus JB14]
MSFTPFLTINTSTELFYDPRADINRGPTRNVRLPRACTNGGLGAISKSPDGTRCVVTGKECKSTLKILRIVDPLQTDDLEDSTQYKTSAVGRGGFRIEASRNFWEGSGLKIDSTSTSVAWCREEYKNKILTSARNGELIMWDINKSGSKYERKSKDHLRSIHALSISPVVSNYCITGSSDGDLRVWDLREFQKSIMRVRHPTGIRGIVFSPVVWSPLQAVVGLENGSIYRWDLKMGQRGSLDRIPVAHSASVTSLDWCSTSTATTASGPPTSETTGNGYGWIVSGGLDRCVKVWDLTSVTNSKSSHMPHKPTYTMHPSFPVRRVLWRPSHECEVAIISNGDFGSGSNHDMSTPGLPTSAPGAITRTSSMRSVHAGQGMLTKIGTGLGLGLDLLGSSKDGRTTPKTSSESSSPSNSGVGDAAEIWDVRRGWLPKWKITGSAIEGGSTDVAFGDEGSLWTQHSSGMFSQIDLRDATRPIDAMPRVSLTSDPSGSLTFVSGSASRWEIPYDDIRPESLKQASKLGIKPKGIGDPIFQNNSQIVGTLAGMQSDNLEIFVQLARNYIIEGDDRQKICTSNAQIAFEAGHFEAAQVWSLVAESLGNIIPDAPPRPPLRSNMIQSSSEPAIKSYSFPADNKTSPGDKSARGSEKAGSIYNNHMYTRSLSTTSGKRKRTTPASSNNTSPHYGFLPLPPPMTPITGRRESLDASITGLPGMAHSRRPSMYRRPSTSYSASPSGSSLKHVGEGALDDSDSSSSDSGANEQKDASFDEEDPLSRVAGQHRWKVTDGGKDEENDDDEASASPRSTDSEASNDGKSFRRNSTSLAAKKGSKSKSQNATLQTQAQPMVKSSRLSISTHQKPLVRQGSASSIRTVTAGGEASYRGDQNGFSTLKAEETIKDLRNVSIQQPQDKLAVCSETKKGQTDGELLVSKNVVWTQRHGDIVEKEERKMRNMAWAAVHEKLEELADDGDVQMCAMLAILVSQELSMGAQRRLMFIESYIDHLNRLQLFTCASYVRKHVHVEEVQNPTLIETIIYTACGRCKKAFVSTSNQAAVTGDYSYCASCRAAITCSICRLPVRSLIHGGHQLCYRQYYGSRPMVDVPSTAPSDFTLTQSNQTRGSEPSRSIASTASIASTDDETLTEPSEPAAPSRRLYGHLCVVPLCGHHCWIASVEENHDT